ncbi:MAG: hypothetical protein ACLVKE_07275 [Clostridium baratii]
MYKNITDISKELNVSKFEVIRRLSSIGAITYCGKTPQIMMYSDYEEDIQIRNGELCITDKLKNIIA